MESGRPRSMMKRRSRCRARSSPSPTTQAPFSTPERRVTPHAFSRSALPGSLLIQVQIEFFDQRSGVLNGIVDHQLHVLRS